MDAYAHLQGLELAYFEERSTGGLMSVLSDDVNQLERFLDHGASDLLQVATTVLVIGGAFFVLAPSVAWMAMLPMPFVVWGSIWFQKRLAPYYADVREKVGLLNGRLVNNLGGITTIKAYVAEAFEIEQVRRESEAYREANRRAIRLSAAFVPLIRVVILVGFTATLLYGGMEVVNGTLSVGTYSVLVFLTQRLLWPLTRLGETLDQYQRAMASTTRVMNLLDTPFEIHAGRPSPLPRRGPGRGGAARASTSPTRNGVPVLHDVSLRVPAGATVGIVGSTGSGKSTLIKLLLRLYEVESGSLTLDGVPVRELRLEDLRGAIGLVSQDVFLFHGTVRENLVYGSWGAGDAEVRARGAARRGPRLHRAAPAGLRHRGRRARAEALGRPAPADRPRPRHPQGPADPGPRRGDLGGGQRDRGGHPALARAHRAHRTTIAIAHRLSTVRHADRICVLEQGRVVEEGTHEELLERDGVYAALWRVQTGALAEVG